MKLTLKKARDIGGRVAIMSGKILFNGRYNTVAQAETALKKIVGDKKYPDYLDGKFNLSIVNTL